MMIEIYTDGSALARKTHKDNRKGGIGVVFVVNSVIRKKISKGYSSTKIGRMELTACLTALKTFSKDQQAIIYSDSTYVVDCFNKGRLVRWERRAFPVKNKDILIQLLAEHRKFPKGAITYVHVKGHAGNEFNEMADKLANYKQFQTYEFDTKIEE